MILFCVFVLFYRKDSYNWWDNNELFLQPCPFGATGKAYVLVITCRFTIDKLDGATVLLRDYFVKKRQQ